VIITVGAGEATGAAIKKKKEFFPSQKKSLEINKLGTLFLHSVVRDSD